MRLSEVLRVREVVISESLLKWVNPLQRPEELDREIHGQGDETRRTIHLYGNDAKPIGRLVW